jgi:hypothetical protein
MNRVFSRHDGRIPSFSDRSNTQLTGLCQLQSLKPALSPNQGEDK